jgi:hypothetical protein
MTINAAERSQWSWALLRRSTVAAMVCLWVGGAIGYALTHQAAPSSSSTTAGEPPHPRRPPAGAAELALLAPLLVGGSLEDSVISRIDAVTEGRIVLICTRGGKSIELDVMLASADAPLPPATSGRYAVYYSAGASSSGDESRLAVALAHVLDTHASEPGPAGLTPFRLH